MDDHLPCSGGSVVRVIVDLPVGRALSIRRIQRASSCPPACCQWDSGSKRSAQWSSIDAPSIKAIKQSFLGSCAGCREMDQNHRQDPPLCVQGNSPPQQVGAFQRKPSVASVSCCVFCSALLVKDVVNRLPLAHSASGHECETPGSKDSTQRTELDPEQRDAHGVFMRRLFHGADTCTASLAS